MLEDGAAWAVKQGYGTEDDLEVTESGGCFPGADPDCVSDRAIQRGHRQLGTLGSGNHYLEIQVARREGVYDEELAGGDLELPGATLRGVAATRVAREADAPMGASLVLLGAFCANTGAASLASLNAAVKDALPPYRAAHIPANERALEAGFAALPRGETPAFGGTGAETFGVKSGGISRFTFLLAGIFCGSAILISATWNV